MRNNPLREAPLFRLAICLIVGIVMADRVAIDALALTVVFASMLMSALFLSRWPRVQSAGIALCFVVLGMLLTVLHRNRLAVSCPDHEVVYEAVVFSEPVEKPKTVAVDIVLPANQRKLKCYLYKDERSRRLRIGDGLRIQSRITENSNWHSGHFDYRRYLEVHGFTGQTFVSSWKWQKVQISLGGLSRLDRTRLFFLKLRSQLLGRLTMDGMDEDAYGVVAAMVLGDKSALSKDVKEVYSLTGASHVLALSGLHLGIIYTLLSLLVAGRRWRVVSQMLIVLAIWAFVLLVGMSVSVVRSAVMLSVYALLSLGHRDKMSVNTLAFAAILLLMQNPYALFDVGFQMSFMAVFSILLWLPVLQTAFSPEYLMAHRWLKWSWGMVIVSLAAQIGVAPLIAYYFGRISTYFLLTNFIVIPAVTLVLWLSLAVLVVPSLAYLLLFIVGWMNRVLTVIAGLPGANIENLQPTGLQVSMVYVIIGAVWLLLMFTCSRAIGGYRSGWLQPSAGRECRTRRTQRGS